MSGHDIDALIVACAEDRMEREAHSGRAFHVKTATLAAADALGVDVHALQREYSRDATRYVDTVLDAHKCDWTLRVVPEHWDLRDGRGVACTDGANYIGIASNDTTALALLHECAHVLVMHRHGYAYKGHGAEFQQIAHALYNDFLGVDAAQIFAHICERLTC